MNNRMGSKIQNVIFIITIWLSVISQNFILRESFPLEMVCDLAWILSLVILVGCKKLTVRANKFLYHYIVVIILALMINNLIINGLIGGNFSVTLNSIVPPPFLVYFVTYSIFAESNTKKNIYIYIMNFMAACFILSVSFMGSVGVDWSSWGSSYVYVLNDGKNAIGHMLGIGIVVTLFYTLDSKKSSESRIVKIILSWPIKFITILFFFAVVLYVQCRTALLDVAIVILLAATGLIKNRRLKIVVWCAIVVGACLILFNSNVNATISHALFLDKYDDLNSFSSGRLESYANAIRDWWQNPIFGVKEQRYIDNYYINVLVNNGLFGAALYWSLWFRRIYLNFKNCRQGLIPNGISNVVKTVTVYEIVTSFLEALPPFGPGVSVLFFWFISAICDCFANDRRNLVARENTWSKNLL